MPQKTVDAVPVTAFSATPAIGSVPLTVSFKDQSTGRRPHGNGLLETGGNSTEKNPVHTYNKAGKYNVTLTASNANGNNALTKTGYILVSGVSDAPLSRFSASPTSGKAPLTVSFTDQSTGGAPAAWRWTFGDGSGSREKNPVHTYNESGQYTVTLTASNANGSNALTKSRYIVVSSTQSGPVANFSASHVTGKAPLTVSFTDQSTGLRIPGNGLSGGMETIQ